MNRISWTIAAFSIGFSAVHIIPLLVWRPLPWFPLIGIGTTFDLFSPLIMLPIYMLLYRWSHQSPLDQSSLGWGLLFLLLAVLWVEGHSIHLPSNAISLALKGARVSGDPEAVTHLFDENLGHYIWHLGMVGLSGLIVLREWRHPVPDQSVAWLVILSGALLYGATFLGAVIEGGTWPIGLTFSVAFCIVSLVWGRSRLAGQPMLSFFTIAYFLATVGVIVWFILWGGLPQFSDVGIIK